MTSRIALVATAIAVVTVSGCAPTATPVPSAAEVVGTWHSSASEVGTLVLGSDGRCSAVQLTTADGSAAGACTWRVGSRYEGARAKDGSPIVELDFSAVKGTTVGITDFEVEGSGAAIRLWAPIDDPDLGHRFTLHRG